MPHKVSSGFTLIETVITLGLLTSLLVVAVARFPQQTPQFNNETAFWDQFQTLWQERVFIASAKDYQQMVWFDRDAVRFVPLSPEDHLKAVTLRLPKTLHKVSGTPSTKIMKNGHPKLAAVYYRSTLEPHNLTKLSVKMGWGAYSVDQISG
ncbi:type II secretion protein [Lactiplantibacillus brownii]